MGPRKPKQKQMLMPERAEEEPPSDDANDAKRDSRRDKISLNPESDSESDDGLDGEEVLALSDSDDDEDEFGDDDEEDDDDDEDDEDALIEKAIARGGKMGEMARQAKLIGQRLKLQQAKEEGDDEEDVKDEKDEALWGANKRRYYDADELEDEEELKEEEEEVVRLQKERAAKLSLQDYGLDDEDEDEDEDDEDEGDGEDTLEGMAKRASKGGKAAGKVHVESVSKDLAGLSADEKMGALMADAPELLALVQDLKDTQAEVRHSLGPVLKEVRDANLATPEGLSYLEAKHLLLTQYCSHIVFYILMKSEGRPVKDHPVISKLVELRGYLEKLAPLDKKLGGQVERMLLAAQIAATANKGADEELGLDGDEDGDDLQAGTSDHDRVAAEVAGGGKSEKQKKKKKSKKAAQTGEAVDSLAAVRIRQQNEARASLGEDLPPGLMTSKERAKRIKQQQRLGMTGTTMMADFAEDLPNGDGDDGEDEGLKLTDLFNRQKVSQKFGGEPARLKTQHTGDDDLPRREPLHERRARYDAVAARKLKDVDGGADDFGYADGDGGGMDFFGGGIDDMLFGDDGDEGGGGKKKKKKVDKRERGEEDGFYAAAKAEAEERKKVRHESHSAPALLPPLPDNRTDGARAIGSTIERNRGLTPHRRKDIKNPRKKNRVKFQKALVRRSGAVQAVRDQSAPYAGETTGLKSRTVKSRKLG